MGGSTRLGDGDGERKRSRATLCWRGRLWAAALTGTCSSMMRIALPARIAWSEVETGIAGVVAAWRTERGDSMADREQRWCAARMSRQNAHAHWAAAWPRHWSRSSVYAIPNCQMPTSAEAWEDSGGQLPCGHRCDAACARPAGSASLSAPSFSAAVGMRRAAWPFDTGCTGCRHRI